MPQFLARSESPSTMHRPDGAVAGAHSPPVHLAQRTAALEREADQARTADGRRARVSSSGVPTPGAALLPGVAEQLAAERRGGHALPPALRAGYETRLGHDFSLVRVHDGVRAARLGAGLGAEAFTVGRDIVLGGRLDAADRTGLLAHELAHVAQLGGRDGLVLRQARPAPRRPAW